MNMKKRADCLEIDELRKQPNADANLTYFNEYT